MHPPGAQVLKYVHPAAKKEFNNQNSRNVITPYGPALVKRLYDTGTYYMYPTKRLS